MRAKLFYGKNEVKKLFLQSEIKFHEAKKAKISAAKQNKQKILSRLDNRSCIFFLIHPSLIQMCTTSFLLAFLAEKVVAPTSVFLVEFDGVH